MLWIFSNYGDVVRSFEHSWTVEREWQVLIFVKIVQLNLIFRLSFFARKISEKGCPLPDCFGFIDGTHIEGTFIFYFILFIFC